MRCFRINECTSRASRTTRRAGSSRCPCRASRTGCAIFTGCPCCSGCSGQPLRPHRAHRPALAAAAARPHRSCGSGRAGRPPPVFRTAITAKRFNPFVGRTVSAAASAELRAMIHSILPFEGFAENSIRQFNLCVCSPFCHRLTPAFLQNIVDYRQLPESPANTPQPAHSILRLPRAAQAYRSIHTAQGSAYIHSITA